MVVNPYCWFDFCLTYWRILPEANQTTAAHSYYLSNAFAFSDTVSNTYCDFLAAVPSDAMADSTKGLADICE